MRNVIFIAPFLMETTLRFVDGIRGLDNTRVLGLVQKKPGGIDPAQRARFDHVYEVDDAFSAGQLLEGARWFEKEFGPIHRVANVLEHIQIVAAKVREAFGCPGLDVAAATRFLDKNVMKAALRAGGFPCARHATIRHPREGIEFTDTVGFPVVVKPPIGAACHSTYRVGSREELVSILDELRPSIENPVQIEEFITGDEHSFETLCIDGEVKMHSISRYYPGCLEVMRNPWIKYCVVLPRDISGPEYDDTRKVGIAAVKALGMKWGLTHMEWFRRPDGSMAIGEIAARPAGANITRMMCYAYDVDMYRVWGRAIVDGAFDGPFERKFAVGTAFLRSPGQGRVAGTVGVEEVNRRVGQYVVEARMPVRGEPKSPEYEGDGYVIVRHETTEKVRELLSDIITNVHVQYE
jgi:D-alanine-D-alanine ligase-like ATP-grasp enzyme